MKNAQLLAGGPVAGTLKSIKVSGAITSSIIAAGLNPVNGIYLDGDDTIVTGSAIKSLATLGIVSSDSRILASSLPKFVSIGKVKLDPTTDDRFKLIASN